MDEIVKVVKIDTKDAEAQLNKINALVESLTNNLGQLGEAVPNRFGSMREAKNYVDSLRASLLNLEKGTDEYNKVADRIRQLQPSIDDAMAIGKKTYDGVSDSLNGMRKNLRDLIHQYDALSKTDREGALGQNLKKQIGQVGDEVKKLENETGRFQRNVGNYAGDISKALSGIGVSAGGAVMPVTSLSAALNALAANPIVLALAAIIGLFVQLKEAIERDEVAQAELNKTTAPFKAIINEIKRAFDQFVTTLTPVIEKLKELKGVQAALNLVLNGVKRFVDGINLTLEVTAQALDSVAKYGQKIEDWLESTGVFDFFEKIETAINNLFNKWAGTKIGEWLGLPELMQSLNKTRESVEETTQTFKAITDAELKLAQERRRITVENSRLESQASEARAKAMEQDKYTAQQRLAFLQEGQAKEEQIYENNRKVAEQEFEIAKMRASLNKTGTEDLQALADAEANVNKAITAQNNMRRQYARESNRIRKQALSEAKAAGKETVDNQKKIIENELSLAEKGSQEEYELKVKLAQLNHKLKVDSLNETVSDLNTRNTLIKQADSQLAKQLESLAKEYQSKSTETFNKMREEANKQQITQMNVLALKEEKNSIKRLKTEAKILEKELSYIINNDREKYNSEIEWTEAIEEKKLEIKEKYQEISSREYDSQLASYEIDINLSKGWDKIVAERKKISFELEKIQRQEGESENEYLARRTALEREYADKSKEIIDSQIEYWKTFGESIGSIFDTIADYYKEDIEQRLASGKINEEQSKKEFERVKALQIAAAIINTISGALGAFMQSVSSYPPPYGQILGALQSASVVAAGTAEIAKLRNTQLNSSTASVNGVTTATVTPNAQNYNNVYQIQNTGLSEISVLNDSVTNGFNSIQRRMNSQRVVLVEADVTSAQARSSQRRVETTW